MAYYINERGALVSTRYSAFDYEYDARQGHEGQVILWVWMTMYELETIGM